MLIKPKYLILHHSYTKDSGTVSWQAIRRYHTDTLGWRDIGYHYGIELVNDEYEILIGRLEGETGAHTRGHNRDSIGICLVGNFDSQTPDQDQWNMLLELVANLCLRYDLNAEDVKGHREFASYKSCPGTSFDLDKFRADLSAII
jgi:hypothetical protein